MVHFASTQACHLQPKRCKKLSSSARLVYSQFQKFQMNSQRSPPSKMMKLRRLCFRRRSNHVTKIIMRNHKEPHGTIHDLTIQCAFLHPFLCLFFSVSFVHVFSLSFFPIKMPHLLDRGIRGCKSLRGPF